MELEDIFGFFFEGFFSSSFKGLLIFSNLEKNYNDLNLHVSLMYL
jgi:hypothetical protein